jgi:hypothetical protein
VYFILGLGGFLRLVSLEDICFYVFEKVHEGVIGDLLARFIWGG